MGQDPLREQLGAKPPKGLDVLEPAQRAQLAEALGTARRRQSEALDAALAGALNQVPTLLRGTVKRMLRG